MLLSLELLAHLKTISEKGAPFYNALKTGQHSRCTKTEAVDIVRQMAGRYPDDEIALTLNRVRLKTGAGNSWSEARVRYLRKDLQLPAYPDGQPEDRLNMILIISSSSSTLFRTRHSGFSRLMVNQRAHPLRYGRPARLNVADLPGPEQTKAFPVPADNGRGFDDKEAGLPVVPDDAQPGP